MSGLHRTVAQTRFVDRWVTVDLSRRPVLAAWSAMLVLVVLAAVVGLSTLPSVRHSAALPPTPPSPVAVDSSAGTTPASAAPTPTRAAAPITCRRAVGSGGSARPARLCIPALRVDATVLDLGLNSDHTVEVPPLSKVGDAGWYRYSAVPGEVGPTVILGHVDSATYGDGVFYRLGTMRPGETVELTRGDGRIATFRIDRVKEVSKKHFPSDDVYGPTSGPAIRLVTCGGRFDSATGSYVDNIIAFGTLLSLR